MLRKATTVIPWVTFTIATAMVTLFWWADGSTDLWLTPEDHGVSRVIAGITGVASHADAAHLAGNVTMLLFAGSIVEMGLSRFWLPVCFAAAVTDNLLLGDPGVRQVGASGMVYALVGIALIGWVRHFVGAQTETDPSLRQNTAVGGAGFLAVLAPYPLYEDVRQALSPLSHTGAIVVDAVGHLRLLSYGLAAAAVCYARYAPGVGRHIMFAVRTQWRMAKAAR